MVGPQTHVSYVMCLNYDGYYDVLAIVWFEIHLKIISLSETLSRLKLET